MTKTSKSYENVTIKNLDKSRVEIRGSIPATVWGAFRSQALKNINNSVTIDGFRKGMVPENVLVSKAGEMAILEEMAELALSKAYIDILVDNAIDAIGKPSIQLTKLAKENPLEFTATTSVVPQFTLPEYKKIATDVIAKSDPQEEKATDADIEEAILRIRKSRVSHEGHDHDKMSAEDHDKLIESSLPELTDDFVKTLGEFADVPDFKNKLSVMVAEEKRDAAYEKRRVRIADALNDATTVELPEMMLESELNRMESQFESDIARMNVKMDDYLKHAKKTIADIRAEWRPHAEKKVKFQLILNAIAAKENISADAKEIENEVNHIVEHYKDADRESAAVYATTILTNEKVFKFLEK